MSEKCGLEFALQIRGKLCWPIPMDTSLSLLSDVDWAFATRWKYRLPQQYLNRNWEVYCCPINSSPTERDDMIYSVIAFSGNLTNNVDIGCWGFYLATALDVIIVWCWSTSLTAMWRKRQVLKNWNKNKTKMVGNLQQVSWYQCKAKENKCFRSVTPCQNIWWRVSDLKR